MKIGQIYSHLNGEEYLIVHKSSLWTEVRDVIGSINALQMKTKVSKEKTKVGTLLYNPGDMNKAFERAFTQLGWAEKKIYYRVTSDLATTREIASLKDINEQEARILANGFKSYSTYNQVDFVKDRVAVEVQFGKYFSVQYDLHVKHTFFYQQDEIDVGIEIIPMHVLMREMSSGVPWYENELMNIVREGRSNPPIPMVLIGIEP